MLPAKFGSIWLSSFRGEDFFNSSQSEKKIALGGHVCWANGTKRRSFIEWLPRAILVSDWLMLNKSSPLKLLGQIKPNLVGSIYVRSSIKLLLLVPFAPLANQKQKLLLAAIFVGQTERNEETL
jgi:hypothetical protein